MEATAADSLSDTAATAAVLLAMLIAKWTGLDIDGWVGLVVAGFILFSGVKSARETISPLLGQPPEKEFVDRIQAIVLSHPEILGLHDLVVHDYGPGRVMVSLHAEVPAHGDLLELHDVVDNIEMDLSRQLNCQAVIHMDPVVTDDGLTGPLRSRVAELVKQVDPGDPQRDSLGPGQQPADGDPGLYGQLRGDAGGQRRDGQPEPAVPGGVLRPGRSPRPVMTRPRPSAKARATGGHRT